MRQLVKCYDALLTALAVVAALAVTGAFVLIIIGIAIRLTGPWTGIKPPAYTIAVVEYLLLYFTMFTAPWLVRRKGHVYVDSIIQLLPRKVRAVLAKIVYTLCILASLTFGYFSIGLLTDAYTTALLDVRGVDMPQWLLYAPLPVAFLLIAIEFARYLLGFDDMYEDRTTARESV